MFFILIASLILLPTFAGWGGLLEHFFGKICNGFSGKVIVGIFGISVFFTLVSFFLPINNIVEVVTIIGGISLFIKNKIYKELKIEKKYYFPFSVIVFLLLFVGSFFPFILDHFGYYIPSIKWISEVGLVKGIGNLDLTLGQMSIWHILQAGFSHFADPFFRLNTVLLLVYLIYIFEAKKWIHLCCIPILFLFAQSPSPDLPVIIFALIVLDEVFNGNKNYTLLFAFSVFVFAIKPTMCWLPMFVLLQMIVEKKFNISTLGTGIFVLLLFFFKNIWTFGYPVFPIAIGDIGVSWKPNPIIMEQSSRMAIAKTYDMQYTTEQIQNFSTLDYIKNWLYLAGIKSKINILFIVSLLFFGIFAAIKRNRLITILFVSILVKSIFVLLFSAQYRFFLDVFFVIFLVLFLPIFNYKKSIISFGIMAAFFVSFLSFSKIVEQKIPSFKLGKYMGSFQWKQIYKPSEYTFKSYETYPLGNLKFNISKAYPFNYNTPLPAISPSFVRDYSEAGVFPQLIDSTNIKKGFIHQKLSSEEEIQAKNILKSIKKAYK